MRRAAGLICLMATLCLIVAWELVAPEPGSDTPQTSDPDAASAATAANSGKAPSGQAAASALAQVAATIVERPLFSPGRRASGRPANTAAVAAMRDGLPRLAGVIVGPDGGRAIFAGADGKSHTAAAGDAVGGFTIRAIGPGTVTLAGSEGERVLRPTYVTVAGVTAAGANTTSRNATGRNATGPDAAGPDTTGPDVTGPDVTGRGTAGGARAQKGPR